MGGCSFNIWPCMFTLKRAATALSMSLISTSPFTWRLAIQRRYASTSIRLFASSACSSSRCKAPAPLSAARIASSSREVARIRIHAGRPRALVASKSRSSTCCGAGISSRASRRMNTGIGGTDTFVSAASNSSKLSAASSPLKPLCVASLSAASKPLRRMQSIHAMLRKIRGTLDCLLGSSCRQKCHATAEEKNRRKNSAAITDLPVPPPPEIQQMRGASCLDNHRVSNENAHSRVPSKCVDTFSWKSSVKSNAT